MNPYVPTYKSLTFVQAFAAFQIQFRRLGGRAKRPLTDGTFSYSYITALKLQYYANARQH